MEEEKQALQLPEENVETSEMSEDEIDYNVMGSFPASDPPAWTLGISPDKKCCHEFEGEKPSIHDPSHQNESPSINTGQ